MDPLPASATLSPEISSLDEDRGSNSVPVSVSATPAIDLATGASNSISTSNGRRSVSEHRHHHDGHDSSKSPAHASNNKQAESQSPSPSSANNKSASKLAVRKQWVRVSPANKNNKVKDMDNSAVQDKENDNSNSGQIENVDNTGIGSIIGSDQHKVSGSGLGGGNVNFMEQGSLDASSSCSDTLEQTTLASPESSDEAVQKRQSAEDGLVCSHPLKKHDSEVQNDMQFPPACELNEEGQESNICNSNTDENQNGDVQVAESSSSSSSQKSLSRTSSLNAGAKEFVPGNFGPKIVSTAAPPAPAPMIIPIGSTPGILSPFPPSPIAPPQLGGFPMPLPGPPPPPIPVSLMGPMPMLGPSHSGLMNVQMPGPPPPPVIPAAAYMMPPTTTVQVHSQTLSGCLLDPNANPSMGQNADSTPQDQPQTQDVEANTTQVSTQKNTLNEELRAKIVRQVEFYFSDANLPTDYFLMKYVKKDPEGSVPISVVASFRKIKNLVKNHSLVALALRTSKELVVSEDGKKVRRLHPLPHIDIEEIQSRTVVAENLPADHSIESMEKLFSSVGNVKMVRVCEPEAANSANQITNKYKSDYVVSNKLHALVEYESIEQAEKAVSTLNDQRNWRSGLHVRLLLRRTFQNKHGHQGPAVNKHGHQAQLEQTSKMAEDGDASGGEEDNSPSTGDAVSEKTHDENNATEEHTGNENHHSEKDGNGKRVRNRGRGRGRGRGQYHHHPNGGHGGRGHHPVGTPPQSTSGVPTCETKPPPGPRMPDGTRGFTFGRGKNLSVMSS